MLDTHHPTVRTGEAVTRDGGVAVVGLDDTLVGASGGLRQLLRLEECELKRYRLTHFVEEAESPERALFAHLARGLRDAYEVEQVYLRSDGSTFLGHARVTLIRDASGEPDYAVAILRDVTEARQSEGDSHEAGEETRLGEMAAVIAHEVRNPLAGIRGAVDIIGRALPRGSAERDIVGTVLDRVSSLDALLTQLLVFARPPRPRFASLSVRRQLEFVAASLGEGTFEIGDGDAVISGDAGLIERAFRSLAVNGMQAGGQARPPYVEIHPGEHECTIDFVDHGAGIPETMWDRIFDPFITTKSRGAGLGLTIAKRTIEAHGGTIELLDSRPGSTTFRVCLPCVDDPSASPG